MITGASLFTGGGGADIGMKMAGVTPIWGIEYDNDIASVARLNGIHADTGNALYVDPSIYPPVDILHASPPCPNFSIAKRDAEESDLDIALAIKVTKFVEVLRPRIFTLENVWGYRNSESWRIICSALYGAGYGVSVEHVNFADYGVPQSRKRMIVRAALGRFFVPPLPAAQPHTGWYQAVADLIPEMQTTQFADWQLRLLSDGDECPVIGHYTAYLTDIRNSMRSPTLRDAEQPAMTVLSSSMRRKSTTPMAILFDEDSKLTRRTADEPAMTILRNASGRHRVLSEGRIVRLSVRALARIQTFPNWYQFPTNENEACQIIGNACPPLGMKAIFESLINACKQSDKTTLTIE